MQNKRKLIVFFIACFIQSVAMADELGQMMLLHPVMGWQMVTYEAMDGYAVVEGDILLNLPKKQTSLLLQASMVRLEAQRWPNGVIPYELDENLPPPTKEAVWLAMDHWQRRTNVVFVELTSANRSQYSDYVAFVPEKGRLCASYVGRHGGRQVVQLSARCDTMITVHELGHVLGLWHEQSRGDRDAYVRILWENIEDVSKYNFEQKLSDGVDYGEYDYQSIMHYSPVAFSKNGAPTIVPLMQDAVIGQREEISSLDRAVVNFMYPALNIKQEPYP